MYVVENANLMSPITYIRICSFRVMYLQLGMGKSDGTHSGFGLMHKLGFRVQCPN